MYTVMYNIMHILTVKYRGSIPLCKAIVVSVFTPYLRYRVKLGTGASRSHQVGP